MLSPLTYPDLFEEVTGLVFAFMRTHRGPPTRLTLPQQDWETIVDAYTADPKDFESPIAVRPDVEMFLGMEVVIGTDRSVSFVGST